MAGVREAALGSGRSVHDREPFPVGVDLIDHGVAGPRAVLQCVHLQGIGALVGGERLVDMKERRGHDEQQREGGDVVPARRAPYPHRPPNPGDHAASRGPRDNERKPIVTASSSALRTTIIVAITVVGWMTQW